MEPDRGYPITVQIPPQAQATPSEVALPPAGYSREEGGGIFPQQASCEGRGLQEIRNSTRFRIDVYLVEPGVGTPQFIERVPAGQVVCVPDPPVSKDNVVKDGVGYYYANNIVNVVGGQYGERATIAKGMTRARRTANGWLFEEPKEPAADPR